MWLKALLVLILFLFSAPLMGQTADTIAIKAALLIDGKGGPPIADGVVVVEKASRYGKILAVGPASSVEIPEGAEIIDVGDETIMPGMVNTHGHTFIQNRPEPEGPAYAVDAAKPKYNHMPVAIRHARVGLLSGTTTIRITSDYDFVDVYLKDMVDKGMFPGPRYITGGVGMTSTGGHGFSNWDVDGVENIRRFVRWGLKHGSEQIKLSMNDISPDETYWTIEELKAAVDELHRHRRWVTAHASGPYGSSVRRVIEAGVDSIEHGRPLNDDLHAVYLSRKTDPDTNAVRSKSYKGVGLSQTRPGGAPWQGIQRPLSDPTNYYNVMNNVVNSTKELNDWVRAEWAKWREANPHMEEADPSMPMRNNWPRLNYLRNENQLNYDRPEIGGGLTIGENLGDLVHSHKYPWEGMSARVRALYSAFKAGVKVGVGLDGPYAELPLLAEWMVKDGGFSTREALLVVTRDGAIVAGVGEKVGTLEVGKYADVISIRGNPLEDITTLSDVNLIMVGGKRYQVSYR